jgi:hypothetical protein
LEWASHLYETQREAARADPDQQQSPSFALPNRVAELLAPYRMTGIA